MPKFLFMNSYAVQQIAAAGTWKRTRAVAPENKACAPSRAATCRGTLQALADAETPRDEDEDGGGGGVGWDGGGAATPSGGRAGRGNVRVDVAG